jgi:hypothetical protein
VSVHADVVIRAFLLPQEYIMSAQGTWNLVMKTPVGDKKIAFAFAVDGAALTGTMIDDGKVTDIVKGTVEGDTLKLPRSANRCR